MGYTTEHFRIVKKELEELNKSSLLEDYNRGYLRAMRDYENLILPVVSQQRELLISFLEYLRVRDIANTKKDNIEVRVDLFIERNL